jgi:hypothetical protein
MKLVRYAGGQFMTGDDIAAAVLEHAAALAQSDGSETVQVPGINDVGRGEFEMLLGPASQLLTELVDSDLPELVDEAFVSDLRERTAQMRASTGPAKVVIDNQPSTQPSFLDSNLDL